MADVPPVSDHHHDSALPVELRDCCSVDFCLMQAAVDAPAVFAVDRQPFFLHAASPSLDRHLTCSVLLYPPLTSRPRYLPHFSGLGLVGEHHHPACNACPFLLSLRPICLCPDSLSNIPPAALLIANLPSFLLPTLGMMGKYTGWRFVWPWRQRLLARQTILSNSNHRMYADSLEG